jgi:uncharacterized phage protein (TIGR01671 family)
MREIKYRARITGTNDWVIGVPHNVYSDKNFNHQHYDSIQYWEDGKFDIEYIDIDTLSEFTGLTDKNGVDIYESDVVKQWLIDELEEDGGFYWHAVVKKISCCIVLCEIRFYYKDRKDPEDYTFLYSEVKICEVIGNIHENPELLNQ